MKINPSSTSTALDYGENPNKSSGDQGKGAQQGDDEYQPIVPHEEGGPESARNLRSRKASKKRKKKRSKARKLAERRARQKEDGENEEDSGS
ncbi:hypothetical protein [Endozoicomonas arenosclerae]|uniref:hypothetical protein n=1 Tax=Endozoicomonas arenosclerae TaxID=1633495 RepID=UPI0007844770|nr:hypothetical protein [Endozoicomonas arenosclerae]